MKARSVFAVLLGLGLGLGLSSPALAVSQAGGIVDFFGAGAREEALGNISALSRGGPFAVHQNPATLVLGRSSSIGASKSQLAKGFASDVWIGQLGAAQRWRDWGFGVTYSRLDQGTQTVTNESGQVLASFDSYQTAWELGAGYDFATLLDRDPREVSVAIGLSLKRIHDRLAPDSFTLGGAESEATAYTLDGGLVVRKGLLFPSNGPSEGHGEEAPSRLGLRLAVAMDDLLGAELDFGNQEDPLQRNLHLGMALEASLLPLPDGTPLVEFEVLLEQLESLVEDDDTSITSFGFEVVAAGVASLRMAQYSDAEGRVHGPTMGVGLGMEWAGLPVGSRFDWAHRPQAVSLPRVDIFSLTVSADLFR